MSDPVNIRALAAGTRVVLANGTEMDIVSNPRDGVWLFARDPASPEAEEEMIFAQDVVEVRPAQD